MNLPTTPLLIFGFAGQALFSARFIVQWVASEARKQSVIPLAFWYFSLAGGVFLLIYAILRHDPVFILGQAAGLVVYIRNLVLIFRQRARSRAEATP
jgi:lipid-A-disaccharide synthase-like uncharacterized protein